MTKHGHHLVIEDETMRGLKVFIVNKQEGQFKKGDLSKWINIFINNGIQGLNARARARITQILTISLQVD